MKNIDKSDKRINDKLKFNLRRKKLIYQKIKKIYKVNFELKTKLLIIKTRKKHLTNVFNKNYIYNIITKHLIFNEKLTR